MSKSEYDCEDRIVTEFRLMQGDCLELMKSLPDGSVDMILVDPPYGTINGIAKGMDLTCGFGRSDWDNAIDPDSIFRESSRVLRPNGALLIFSQEPYTSRLIVAAAPSVPFSYRLVWLKDHFANALVAKKAPVSYFEDIAVFFKAHAKHDFAGEHPLRGYAERVKAFIGKPKKQVFADLGSQAVCHFFRTGTTQFGLCTRDTYDQLCALYGLRTMPGFREFDDLAVENEQYREGLIRRMTEAAPKVFNLPDGARYKSNVLRYRKDYTGDHPTQKPVALLQDLITTYSNQGDTVLDFTMGSGSTGVACANTGRGFIGMELDAGYFETATARIEAAYSAPEAALYKQMLNASKGE